MSDRADVIYLYDGSFDGLMCCIFRSYEQKVIPINILPYSREEPSLYEQVDVATDEAVARRVFDGFRKAVSAEGVEMLTLGYLSDLVNMEIKLLYFVRFCMKNGAKSATMLTHPHVEPIYKAVNFLEKEAHKLLGFIRFKEYGDVLIAEISPKARVLSRIAPHFTDRYPDEHFMIVDRTHSEALVYSGGKSEIFPFDNLELPQENEGEADIISAWKTFHRTIAIKSRENKHLQRNLMPLRYRKHIVETDEYEGGERERGTKRLPFEGV